MNDILRTGAEMLRFSCYYEICLAAFAHYVPENT